MRLLRAPPTYFEAHGAPRAPRPRPPSNWIQGEVRRKLKDLGAEDMTTVRIAPEALAALVALVERGVVSSTVAKDVFEKMWTTGRDAQAIIDAEGLRRLATNLRWPRWSATCSAAHPDVGRAVPRRQDRDFRLPRRAGDEGERREGEPEGRERPRPARAGRVMAGVA